MTKSYKSFSHVAFSVILPGGGSKRISFSPRTGGGSVFATDDPKVQAAIEKHPYFGSKVSLLATPAPVAKQVSKRLAEAAEQSPESKVEAKKQTVREIPYTNLSDAKEYLAKTFEIGRTQLRSKEAIKQHAALHGIIFVGIDDK